LTRGRALATLTGGSLVHGPLLRVSRNAAVALLVLVVSIASVGCAAPVRLAPVAEPRACRSAVDGTGRPAGLSVSWLGPDHAPDRQALDAWCEAVGPAVIVEAAAPGAAVGADAIAVVTWNARVGGGDLERLVQALRAGALTDGRPVDQVVLLVQEAYRAGTLVPALPPGRPVPARIAPVPRTGARIDVLDAAERLGLHLYYVPSMRNGRGAAAGAGEDRGNAILSSLPLSHYEAFELPFERQRRVAIAAQVSGVTAGGDPWRLRVVNVHLDNRAGAKRLWVRSAAARANQAEALVDRLPIDLPLVLGGDLNTWLGNSEPALRIIRQALPSRTGRVDARATFAAGLRLDFLFDRVPDGWRLDQRRIDDRFASDHHPVLGELRIR
jgi:endonuclease/exonuclease/phosphatase family metal-dependent hydrolase